MNLGKPAYIVLECSLRLFPRFELRNIGRRFCLAAIKFPFNRLATILFT